MGMLTCTLFTPLLETSGELLAISLYTLIWTLLRRTVHTPAAAYYGFILA